MAKQGIREILKRFCPSDIQVRFLSAVLMYTQCLISKGNKTQVSWIPKKFALKNKVVKLKVDGKWDDGWLIKEVYTEGLITQTSEQAVKKHKKRTGDSLPKERK